MQFGLNPVYVDHNMQILKVKQKEEQTLIPLDNNFAKRHINATRALRHRKITLYYGGSQRIGHVTAHKKSGVIRGTNYKFEVEAGEVRAVGVEHEIRDPKPSCRDHVITAKRVLKSLPAFFRQEATGILLV
jgi:hypothetical protein